MKETDGFKTFLICLRQLHIPPIFQSSLTALYKIGAFGAFSAVFVYVFQYGDKATERQERLWTALREATAWREMHPNSGGNIGQNHILEALTSDCSKFYKDFFFGYFFS